MVRPWQFHITAGVLCLDFANTISWRRLPQPVERVNSFADLASWAQQAKLISRNEERRLSQWALMQPRAANRILNEARSLREALFGVFSAISEGRAPAEDDLKRVQQWIQRALQQSVLIRDGASFRWRLRSEDKGLRAVLDRVSLSAEALLRSEYVGRIGQCSGHACRWLWIDRTRNRSRRWCDMAVCGNRAKARRYYERRLSA